MLNIPECIAYALKNIFTKYSTSHSPIDLTQFQKLFCNVFPNFTSREKGDAMEAYCNLLLAIHCAEIGDLSQGLDENSSRHSCEGLCPSHRYFNLDIAEQLQCGCGAKSDSTTWDFSTFFQPLYTAPLLKLKNRNSYKLLRTARKHLSSASPYSSVLPLVNTIEKFIRNFLYSQTFPVCAGARENCPYKQSTKTITVLKCPRIWVVNLVWQERYPSSSDFLQVISAFPDRIQLSTIYKTQKKQ